MRKVHLNLPVVNGSRSRIVRRTDEDIFYLCRHQHHQECVVYVLINHNVHIYARGSHSTTRRTLDLGAIRC